MDTCIKNIEEKAWKKFKVEAIKNGFTLGEYFTKIVEEHASSRNESNWDRILNKAKKISSKEAKELRNSIKEFREGFLFR